jgi:chitinase
VVAYYTGWSTYGRNYQVSQIPGDKVSHINYAFANIANGQCVLGDSYADVDKFFAGDSWDSTAMRGNFNQLLKLKAKYPHLKTLISVGGWTWSGQFSGIASDPAKRATFVKSCADFMEKYGFDGIDIDWEYPVSGGPTTGVAADKVNYTTLMKDFRAELDRREAEDRREYLLTIAAPAGPSTLQNLEIGKLAATLDWINLMSYDYNGSWDKTTGHNAPLYRSAADNGPAGFDIDASVRAYLASGMPASKLVLGMPLYGRGWSGVTPGTSGTGLHSTGTGASAGTWEAGVLDYDDIKANYLPRMTRYWDSVSKVPYLWDRSTGVFISYDDAQSMQVKARYLESLGLGGVMLWELSGDRGGVLIDALNAELVG